MTFTTSNNQIIATPKEEEQKTQKETLEKALNIPKKNKLQVIKEEQDQEITLDKIPKEKINFNFGNFKIGGNIKISKPKKEDKTKKKVVLVTTTSVPIDFEKEYKGKKMKVWREDKGIKKKKKQ